jgi:cell division protein FtsI/penicillin-binding protein 2
LFTNSNVKPFYAFFSVLFILASSGLLSAEIPEIQAELQKTFESQPGAILIVDPASGLIVASVRSESFFEQKYSPGSLIKIFTLLAFRSEHGKNFPVFHCPPTLANDPLGCWDRNGHGKLDAQTAIALSCNVYFRQLAEQIQPESFIRILKEFELIHKREDLPSACLQDVMIGKTQEWKLYPALLLRAYSALYNRGNLWPLRKGSVSAATNSIYVEQDLIQLIREGMYRSARNGTSVQAASQAGVRLLGKTGTSLAFEEGKTNWSRTQGWWIGFYPEDQPEIAIMTFAPDGRGATEAAPLGGRVLKRYLELTGKWTTFREASGFQNSR